MVEPPTSTDGASGGSTDAPPPGRRRAPRRGAALGVSAVLAIVAVAGGLALWLGGRPLSSSTPASSGAAGRPPLIALVDATGALATADITGRRTPLAAEPGVTFGFPAWSPDGTRIATVRDGPDDSAVAIFAVRRGDPDAGPTAAGPGAAPVVVYRSADVPPFYLYWAPDGQRISFLASEADGLSLRLAPADGSAPLDGSGPNAVLRRGSPLYFDWIRADRLLLHVGTGAEAFLGEVGLDGSPAAAGLAGSGDFRPAVVDTSGRFMAFVRGRVPAAELVVAGRDGSSEHTLPVFGPAAVVFDPVGVTLAMVAADQPPQQSLAFPVGPLRLIDPATGAARTLLDGTVVGFFWSPDGRTIAALRLQAGSGSTVANAGTLAAAARTAAGSSSPAAPTPPSDPELHLLFLNVADGAIRSDRVVRLARQFVNQFLPYFDQYALSHRVWAPDSSALLLPLVDAAGRDQLAILPADGSDGPPPIDGQSGFWSP